MLKTPKGGNKRSRSNASSTPPVKSRSLLEFFKPIPKSAAAVDVVIPISSATTNGVVEAPSFARGQDQDVANVNGDSEVINTTDHLAELSDASEPQGKKAKQQHPNEVLAEATKTDKFVVVFQGTNYNENDLVWAKMDGYPWWPSQIKKDLDEGASVNLQSQIHVQFFGEPVTRGYVRSIEKFDASDDNAYKKGGRFYARDRDWSVALLQIIKAAAKSKASQGSESCPGLKSVDEVTSSKKITGSDCDDSVLNDEKDTQDVLLDSDLEEAVSDSEGSAYNPVKSSSSDEVSSASENDELTELEEAEDDEECAETTRKSKSTRSSAAKQSKTKVTRTQLAKRRSVVATVAVTPKSQQKEATAPRVSALCSTPKTVSLAALPTTPRSASDNVRTNDTSKSSMHGLTQADDSADLTALGDCLTGRRFEHDGEDFNFLKDKFRRDKNKRLPSDPDFDSRTLYVPPDFLKKQTPGLQQWWLIKADNYDVLLFFKVGKFYELYHQDAVIAVKELNLSFMRGKMAHCGFPEVAYGRFSEQLIEKGFKVARIEQVETPKMLEERNKFASGGKKEKVVKRELCRITTIGTKTFGVIDGTAGSPESKYLMSILEGRECSNDRSISFGVCFVDCTTGAMKLAQFDDDEQCSRLRTLLAQCPPAHILHDRKPSEKLSSIFRSSLAVAIKDVLTGKLVCASASDALKLLAEGDYFQRKPKEVLAPIRSDEKMDADFAENEDSSRTDAISSKRDYPPVLQKMLAENDSLKLTAKPEYELVLRSLGSTIKYLTYCKIDDDILSMANVSEFSGALDRPDYVSINRQLDDVVTFPAHMVLDGSSLHNLDIVAKKKKCVSSNDGTLFQRLDSCRTNFGKRLLRFWICSPLCNPSDIRQRQDAVDDLLANAEFIGKAEKILKRLPDLEIQLQKIHSMGLKRRGGAHPDSRAIFFENDFYNKRKIKEFLSALNGFKDAQEILKLFLPLHDSITSTLLRRILALDCDGGSYPDLSEHLQYFDTAFNHDEALKNGEIRLEPGKDETFDCCNERLEKAKRSLQDYLEQQKTKFRNPNLSYVGTGRNRYQLEIPENLCTKISDEYTLESQRKNFRRYRTPTITELFAKLLAAESEAEAILSDIMRRVFERFDQHYEHWKRAVECLSILDVLLSFARYARSAVDYPICRPEIVSIKTTEKPFIVIKNGVHPNAGKIFTTGSFIPNSIEMNAEATKDSSAVVLVTGPNMGGKSTLMRQVGLIVVMAQMGCYVPAEACRLTPVDRIFTRLGASDDILSGQSTFFVELNECSSILRHATAHSLVILDELGRGTSTHDGNAIASAVLRHISERINCRTLFSTHYHSLIDDFIDHPKVQLGRMACMVENENIDDPTKETVTFLYKFEHGACSKSYGFHAAHLAGVPLEIIRRGSEISRNFGAQKMRVEPSNVSGCGSIAPPKSHSSLLGLLEKFKSLVEARNQGVALVDLLKDLAL